MSGPLELLRHHVSGAVERGDAQPIVGHPAGQHDEDHHGPIIDCAWCTVDTLATDLKLGDVVALRHGGTRKITGLEKLPHVVRVRVGRQTTWSRSKPDALWPVVQR
jgi:hypothetical protein